MDSLSISRSLIVTFLGVAEARKEFSNLRRLIDILCLAIYLVEEDGFLRNRNLQQLITLRVKLTSQEKNVNGFFEIKNKLHIKELTREYNDIVGGYKIQSDHNRLSQYWCAALSGAWAIYMQELPGKSSVVRDRYKVEKAIGGVLSTPYNPYNPTEDWQKLQEMIDIAIPRADCDWRSASKVPVAFYETFRYILGGRNEDDSDITMDVDLDSDAGTAYGRQSRVSQYYGSQISHGRSSSTGSHVDTSPLPRLSEGYSRRSNIDTIHEESGAGRPYQQERSDVSYRESYDEDDNEYAYHQVSGSRQNPPRVLAPMFAGRK